MALTSGNARRGHLSCVPLGADSGDSQVIGARRRSSGDSVRFRSGSSADADNGRGWSGIRTGQACVTRVWWPSVTCGCRARTCCRAVWLTTTSLLSWTRWSATAEHYPVYGDPDVEDLLNRDVAVHSISDGIDPVRSRRRCGWPAARWARTVSSCRCGAAGRLVPLDPLPTHGRRAGLGLTLSEKVGSASWPCGTDL